MPEDSRIAINPPATRRQCPGVDTRSLSKKRRKKWRRSSKPVEWVSSSQSRSRISAAHRGKKAANDLSGILLLGELGEHAFQRRLLHQAAQVLHRIVGHHFSLA